MEGDISADTMTMHSHPFSFSHKRSSKCMVWVSCSALLREMTYNFYKRRTTELTRGGLHLVFTKALCRHIWFGSQLKFGFFLTLSCFSCKALLSSPRADHTSQRSATSNKRADECGRGTKQRRERKFQRHCPGDVPGCRRPSLTSQAFRKTHLQGSPFGHTINQSAEDSVTRECDLW